MLRSVSMHTHSITVLILLSIAGFVLGACQQASPEREEAAATPTAQPAPPPPPEDPLMERDDIANYARINETIVAAGQPEPTAWSAIGAAGIKTVVNLRTADEGALEEAALVEQAGMTYVHVPIDSSGFDAEKFEAVERALAGADGGVMIHCASSNRVGAFWYLHRLSEGASGDVAMSEAERAGLRSERLREQVLTLGGELTSNR